MPNAHTLYIVVPCYNEEEVLPITAKKLKEKIVSLVTAGTISHSSRIMFVDDGSKDRTWEIIESLHNESTFFTGIKLSRNRGHQNALLGGLMTAKDRADIVISMDADLQDDIDAVKLFTVCVQAARRIQASNAIPPSFITRFLRKWVLKLRTTMRIIDL